MSESQAELDTQRAADEDPDYWADQPNVRPYEDDEDDQFDYYAELRDQARRDR